MITVSGYIKDNAGVLLPNAEVYFSDASGGIINGAAGTTANLDGYYQLQGDGNYITAAYTGYSKLTLPVTDAPTQYANFKMIEGLNLPEVVISAKSHWKIILGVLLAVATLVFIFMPGNYSKQ